MLVEFSILSVGEGSSQESGLRRVEAVLEASGLDYQWNVMSIVIEGGWDELCAVVKQCHARLRETNSRVVTMLRIDDDGAAGPGRLESIRAGSAELPSGGMVLLNAG